MGAKPLRVRFDKIDRFIEISDRFRCLVLYDYERDDAVYDGIRYLISEKSSIRDNINHNFATVRIDLFNSWPIEKILILHIFITLIKSVVSKNNYDYCCNKFLEKGSYKDKSNKHYFYVNICIYHKCYISIELTVLNKLILLRQSNQKSAIFANIGIF